MFSFQDILTQTQERASTCGICRFKVSQKAATALCVDCKIELCEQCSTKHNDMTLTKDHTLLPISNNDALPSRKNHCRVHKTETVKYYCQTCNSPVCLPCTFLEHHQHSIQEIKQIRTENTDVMERLVQQSDDNLLQLAETKVYLSEVENEMFIRKELVKTDIRRTIQHITDKLQTQEQDILKELDLFYNMTPIINDQRELDRAYNKLEESNKFAKRLLDDETSPITQIVNHKEAMDNLQQAVDNEVPDVRDYQTYLQKYAVYFPGQIDITLGGLLQRTDQNNMAVNSFRSILPPTKAIYRSALKYSKDLQHHIVALTCTPSDHIVLLTLQVSKCE